ncbi:MAG: hypothetical protein ABS75_31695 [Pelagibacterium sp. SCN 63-23]|nr:MAG: hypothetical protein ABS75_31695 [Pelagibacterium sp. SCN 63-23]
MKTGRYLIRVGLTAISMVCLATGPGSAAAHDDCAALAANPYEEGFERIGKDQMDVDIDAAIAACFAAIELDPEDMFSRARLARAYYIGQNYEAMYPHIELAAEAGNAMAQQLLGDSLVDGKGIEKDFERSYALLQASAAQDYAPGLYSLGLSYRAGEGVEKDDAMAAELFARAAAKDHRFALGDLGMMKLNADGIERDVDGGIKLLQRAAALRDSYAMLQLGYLYADSDLVPHDGPRALDYFLAAEAAGEASATAAAAYIYLGEYEGVEADFAEAETMARRAADAEDGGGHFVLGYMAENGLGMPGDLDAARIHYAKGAELGDDASIEALARLR